MRLRHSLLAIILLTLSFNAPAEEPQFTLFDLSSAIDWEFDEVRLGGFERYKLGDSLRVRGWQVGDRAYFGQTKVGKKWGLGFVFEKGDIVYGVNHRGMQITRQF